MRPNWIIFLISKRKENWATIKKKKNQCTLYFTLIKSSGWVKQAAALEETPPKYQRDTRVSCMLPVKQSPEEEVEVSAPQRLLGRLCPSVLASSSPLKAAGDVCTLLMLNPQQTGASVLHANLHFVLRKSFGSAHGWTCPEWSAEPSNLLHLTVPRKSGCVGGGLQLVSGRKCTWLM